MSQNELEVLWIIYRFSWFDKNKKETITPINDDDK